MTLPQKENFWKKARKKPVVVEFREPDPDNNERLWGFKTIPKDREIMNTLEGQLYAVVGRDYVIKGVNGEFYPIRKSIFEKTYDVIPE